MLKFSRFLKDIVLPEVVDKERRKKIERINEEKWKETMKSKVKTNRWAKETPSKLERASIIKNNEIIWH